MNILMLNYEFPPIGGGGGNAHLNLLKQYAKKKGLHVDVLTSSPAPGNTVEPFSENITLYKMGLHKKSLHFWKKTEVLEWLFKARPCYSKLINQNCYDLVHAFFAFPSAYLCLGTVGKIPYIVSLRGSDVPGFNLRLKLDYYLLKGLFHKIWRNANAVVANSKGLAELAEKFEPTLDIGVICNGINTDLFLPPPDRTLTGNVKLLTVCRLIARKRIHLLIEAVYHLKQWGIETELNIVGEGNLLDELKMQVNQLKIIDQVNFLGLIASDKMPSIYQANHFFLMSSAHEGMSNAMLEAMASGLPIITTPCEGTQELVADNGIIVSDLTPEKIAKAIVDTIGDQKNYKQMAEHSRKTAEQFSWENTAEQYLQLYTDIGSKMKPSMEL